MGQAASSGLYADPRRSRPPGLPGGRGPRTQRSHSVPVSQSLQCLGLGGPRPKTSLYKAIRRKLAGKCGMGAGGSSPKISSNFGSKLMFKPGGVRGKAAKDHAKVFRELVSGWSAQELHCLVVEYESSAAVRELTWRADAARHPAPTLKDDLSQLLQERRCLDVTLLFDGREFPAHLAILKHRSMFFRQLLARCQPGERVSVDLPANFEQLNSDSFALLLQYLYTGEIGCHGDQVSSRSAEAIELILKLKDQFGCHNSLEYDAFHMLQQANDTGDALLVFVPKATSTPLPPPSPVPSEAASEQEDEGTLNASAQSPEEEEEDGTVSAEDEMAIWRRGLAPGVPRSRPLSLASSTASQTNKHSEFRCHASVLAARSVFFRNLIEKRLQERRPDGGPLQILLDESVIPRAYAPVLLHALYTDQVDLSQVLRGCPVSVNSLSEVQAIASGKCQMSPVEEATDIYQIARFLDFQGLAQGCENLVCASVSLENVWSVWGWAAEAFGSASVGRRCVAVVANDFARLLNSPLLLDLDEALLVEVFKSDFVQASELEILQAVIKWGEHQLLRRLEEREPNVIAGTTHSITRKGLRRSERADQELREILASLMPLVRTDFILPSYHQTLVQATSRGLVACPPADLPGTNSSGSGSGGSSARDTMVPGSSAPHPDAHWLHPHPSLNPRPRLFIPYFNEARAQLQKRIQESPGLEFAPHSAPSSVLPDALYMVLGSAPQPAQSAPGDVSCGYDWSCESLERLEEYPVPERRTMDVVQTRVGALLAQSAVVRKGLACGCLYHRRATLRQVCLRALREMGLPDWTLRILRCPSKYYGEESVRGSPLPSGRRWGSDSQVPVDTGLAWPDLMGHCADILDTSGTYESWWSAQADAQLSDHERSLADSDGEEI